MTVCLVGRDVQKIINTSGGANYTCVLYLTHVQVVKTTTTTVLSANSYQYVGGDTSCCCVRLSCLRSYTSNLCYAMLSIQVYLIPIYLPTYLPTYLPIPTYLPTLLLADFVTLIYRYINISKMYFFNTTKMKYKGCIKIIINLKSSFMTYYLSNYI